jgi:hypothetical protein
MGRSLLEPFGQYYWEMEKAIEEMTDAGLVALVGASAGLTESNCWYAIYEVAPMIRRMAQDEQKRREYLASRTTGKESDDG